MANPLGMITEMLRSLNHAMGALAGIAQATHQEAQGARTAAERGGGGGGGGGAFDVLSGLPGGSGNARSITRMLSGMSGSSAVPRTGRSSPVTPISEGALAAGTSEGGGGQGLPFTVGKLIGSVFRKMTGSGIGTAGAGAVGAAGQTGMTGGLLLRGGAAAGGAMGMAAAPVAMGLAVFGVSKALGAFGSSIIEQSRELRKYGAGSNASFAAIERQRGMRRMEEAQGTEKSLAGASAAQIEFDKQSNPVKILAKNIKNTFANWALSAGAVGMQMVGTALGQGKASGWGKVAEKLEEQAKTPEQREKDRLNKLSTFGRITDHFLNPKAFAGQMGAPENELPGGLGRQKGKLMGGGPNPARQVARGPIAAPRPEAGPGNQPAPGLEVGDEVPTMRQATGEDLDDDKPATAGGKTLWETPSEKTARVRERDAGMDFSQRMAANRARVEAEAQNRSNKLRNKRPGEA